MLAALPAAAQNQLWIQQPGTSASENASAAAADGSGGVYVSGGTSGSLGGPSAGDNDVWLARYDSAGNQIWIRQLGTSKLDIASAAARDGSDGVYVSGWTWGSLGGSYAGNNDPWLARYDSAGNQLWIRQLGTSNYDYLLYAAPDGSGGVYVGGKTQGSLGGPSAGSEDAWLARYDSAGNQLWIRQLGTSNGDGAHAAASDEAGGVYVGGLTTGSLGGPNAGIGDAWLARYDGAGSQLWIRQLGTSTDDWAVAAAPDGAGGAYASGFTLGSLGGPNAGYEDAWLARYDSAGNKLWILQLGTSNEDHVGAAAPDGAGGVYASGSTWGSLGGPNVGDSDAWLARYDSAGNKLWILQLGTSSGDGASAAAPDGSGGVHVGGSTTGSFGGPNAGFFDAWIARYDGSCGAGSDYCSASTTSIPGCQAAIGAAGSPSLANPGGFTISSGSVPGGGNIGICVFGDNGAASIPFGTLGGQICVQPPVFRSIPKASGGTQGTCNGAFAFTLQDLIATSPIVVVGAVIHAEIWARDPPNPDGFLLSNGLELTVCP